MLAFIQQKTLSKDEIINELAQEHSIISTTAKITEILKQFLTESDLESGLSKILENILILFFNQFVDRRCDEGGIHKIKQVLDQAATQINTIINLNPELGENLRKTILANLAEQIQ